TSALFLHLCNGVQGEGRVVSDNSIRNERMSVFHCKIECWFVPRCIHRHDRNIYVRSLTDFLQSAQWSAFSPRQRQNLLQLTYTYIVSARHIVIHYSVVFLCRF